MNFFLHGPRGIVHIGKEYNDDRAVIGGNTTFTKNDIPEIWYEIFQKPGRNNSICMKFNTGVETSKYINARNPVNDSVGTAVQSYQFWLPGNSVSI